MIINPNYSISYASPLIPQLTGFKSEEIHNKFCYQVLRQRKDPCKGMISPCPLQQVVKSSRPCESFNRWVNSKKKEIPFTVDCYPFKDEDGEVVQVMGVLMNVDKARKMKSEFRRIYRFATMGELFHGIAHNLNTPLSAVVARAEMLGERLKGLKEGKREREKEGSFESKLDKNIRDADVIVTNAMNLSTIIKNVMQKGIQEGEENPQMLNLSYLLKEELLFLESDMKFKHEIKKSYFLDESIPYIEGVYFHFSQSLMNIIKNVMESIDGSKAKELTVSSKYDKDNIYIEIHDTGLETKDITQGHHPLTPSEMRLTQTRELLKPYNAELEVRSKPYNNLYIIRIPYKSGKHH